MPCDQRVAIALGTVQVGELDAVDDALREFQQEGASVQLHPGDVGWHLRFGASGAAAALRTWSRDGEVLAVGLLDETTVLRLAIAPEAQQDEELSHRLVEDVSARDRGVLTEEKACVEAPSGALVRDLLTSVGWVPDMSWSPLRRDLTEPVEDPGLRIEVTGVEQVPVRVAVQRAAFDNSTFTEDRWHAMAAGPAYADARCLVAYDAKDDAVAATTVWSAGPGRPGLIEPLGVHRDHRGRGHGRSISLAAAAALRDLGASSAVVDTPTSNVVAVATYVSAGFQGLPEVPDLRAIRLS